MVNNAEVTIYIKSTKYRFYYSYSSKSIFLDLLEYFSYLFPELNVCQCFEFQINNSILYTPGFKNYGYKKHNKINNNCRINEYSEYLSKLELINTNVKKHCSHYSKNYLRYHKTEIVSFFEKEIDRLKSNNSNQTEKIKNLNKEKNENEKKIYDLNKEKREKEKEIYDLNKEKNAQEMKISNLNKQKIEQEKEINNLNRDKNLLEFAINGDIEKINLLNQLGVEGNNLKVNNNFIQIDNNSNQIKGNQKYVKEKFIDFYDVIIHIDSIKDINKGWKIEFNEKAKEKYESLKNEKIIKIGVIGNSNKGKSFLLSKISKIKLPSEQV